MNFSNKVISYGRIYTLLIASLFIFSNLFAQDNYTEPGGSGPIPDFPGDTCFKINLSQLWPATLDSIYGIQELCLNITHPDPTELDIYLESPDGVSVEISTDNGNGPNMFGTCFNMDSSSPAVDGFGSTFFNVALQPEQPLGLLNNGQTAPGLWQMCITDDTAGNTGQLTGWSVNFGYNPAEPIGTIQPVCNTSITVGCECQGGATSCFLLPDIIIAERIMEEEYVEPASGGVLKVTNATSNIGYGPIEFHGTNEWLCADGSVGVVSEPCADGEYPQQLINQRIYRKLVDENIGYNDVPAGVMQYHAEEGHDHPHIDNWCINTLRIKGPSPNPSDWPIIGTGQKVSFCVENSIQCFSYNYLCEYADSVGDINTMPNAWMGQNYTCNSNPQGVAVGWSDVYGANLSGQEIYFSDNLCNGKYYIVAEFDPDSVFQELNKSNNVTAVPVFLENQEEDCCVTTFNATQLPVIGSVVQFADLTTPEPTTWLWNFGDGNFSSEPFPVHEYDLPGTYEVTLSTENDSSCADFSTINVAVDSMVTNVLQPLTELEFESTLSPNPFYGNTVFQYVIRKKSVVKIQLLNAAGQVVEVLQPTAQKYPGKFDLPIENLATGMYVLDIEVNRKHYFKKLLSL